MDKREIVDAIMLAQSSVVEARLPQEWRERAFAEVLRRLLADAARPHAAGNP